MARSLVVKHEEKLGSSPLLNAFIVLALGWMIGGALLATAAEPDGAAPVTESAK